MEEKEISNKHKKFCKAYVLDWNATRAYQEVYPDSSYDSANANGSRLLVNDSIQAYIKEIQEDIAKLAGLSKLGVLNELKSIIEDKGTEAVAIRDRIKALEVVNKMLSFNDPEKKDHTSGGEPIRGISPIEWVK